MQLGSVETGAGPNVQNEPCVVLIDEIFVADPGLHILHSSFCILHFIALLTRPVRLSDCNFILCLSFL